MLGFCVKFGDSKEIGKKLNPLILVSIWYVPINILVRVLPLSLKKKERKKTKSLFLTLLPPSPTVRLHLRLFCWLPPYLQIMCLYLYFLSYRFSKRSIFALFERRNLAHDPTSSFLFLSCSFSQSFNFVWLFSILLLVTFTHKSNLASIVDSTFWCLFKVR